MGLRSGDWAGHRRTSKSWSWNQDLAFLLEDDVSYGFVIKFQAGLKIIIQNADIEVCIHLPINLACKAHSIPQHTAPHHQRTSSKLQCTFHQPITQALSIPFPCPLHPIWPQTIDFGLIWPHHLLPILHSPVLMADCKVQSGLSMVFGEKWPFLLHHSLHPSLFQVSANSLSRDRLIINVLKSLSDLDSIFSLSSADKMYAMANVGWGKLGKTTTRWFSKVWMMFSAKSRDSTSVYTSGRWYLMSRLTSFKQGKDMSALSSRKRLHVELNKLVVICLGHVECFKVVTWYNNQI